MLFKEILLAVLAEYEAQLGNSNSSMKVIRQLISQYENVSDLDFDIDNADRTFLVISHLSGFSFKILQKLPIPHIAEVIGSNLAGFVKTHHQKLFPGTSIDNAADLVFKMFLLAYFEASNIMKNLTVIQFMLNDRPELLPNE